MKVITNPVFGNIHDAPSLAMNKNVKNLKSYSPSGLRGTSFATTVVAADKESES